MGKKNIKCSLISCTDFEDTIHDALEGFSVFLHLYHKFITSFACS